MMNTDYTSSEIDSKFQYLFEYISFSQSSLMFVNHDFHIQMVNQPAQNLFAEVQTSFRDHIIDFDAEHLVGQPIDIFHKNSNMIRNHLSQLTDSWSTDLVIGELQFKIVVTPIGSPEHREGYVVQWKEQSSEISLMKQIEAFIDIIKHRSHPIENVYPNQSFKTDLSTRQFTVKKGLESILEHLKESTLEEIQAERINTIGFMAAGVAHEINNPISGILANSMYLKSLCHHHESDEILDENIHELHRVANIVKGLLGFSRLNATSVCHPVQMNSVIDQVVQLVKLQLKPFQITDKNRINLTCNINDNTLLLKPKIDEDNLIQILLNLITNAIHVLQESQTINPFIILAVELLEDGFVEISVTNNGPPIPDHAKDQIFMPFYTTKERGKGTGMGLALSRNMAKKCQGSLFLDDAYSGGCRFVIRVPIET